MLLKKKKKWEWKQNFNDRYNRYKLSRKSVWLRLKHDHDPVLKQRIYKRTIYKRNLILANGGWIDFNTLILNFFFSCLNILA